MTAGATRAEAVRLPREGKQDLAKRSKLSDPFEPSIAKGGERGGEPTLEELLNHAR